MATAKLTETTMLNLGFTKKWPGGNPKECWWENPKNIDVGDVWITKLMTRKQFWGKIAEAFRQQGRAEVRKPLREALQTLLK